MTGERDIRAGEYVLGTLSAEERAQFERELAADAEARAAVRAWEARLYPLASAVPDVAPPPAAWAALEARLPTARPERIPPAPTLLADVARLGRALRLWQGAAVTAGALAAGLALFVVLGDPAALLRGERYIAVVNRGAELPALIVRVDKRTGTVQVRSVAAEVPQGHSLELWYIGEGQAPRSLGVVSDSLRASVPAAASALEGATFAVTIEPRGGSPTGGPTGPVAYSGRLLREEP